MFLKEFDIRWSDLDANRHLANSAYINFMSHTRMSYLTDINFAHKAFKKYNIGPVVFYEHVYYFKEVLPGDSIRVSAEFKGMSEDGKFVELHHNFYDRKGKNLAFAELMFGWIDLNERKLVPLPKEALEIFNNLEKAADFKILTKADTRRFAKTPKDLV